MKVVIGILDRIPEPLLVLLFGCAISGSVLAFGMLIILLMWLVG